MSELIRNAHGERGFATGGRAVYDPRKPTSALIGKDLTHREAEAALYQLTKCHITRFRYDGRTGRAEWTDRAWIP